MLSNLSRTRVIVGWFAAVLVIFAFSVVGGAALTPSSALMWGMVLLMPAGVLLFLWPAAPAATMAELMSDGEGPPKK
jgi:hypothetical protein